MSFVYVYKFEWIYEDRKVTNLYTHCLTMINLLGNIDRTVLHAPVVNARVIDVPFTSIVPV